MTRPVRRAVVTLAVSSFLPIVLLGCPPKKETPDAAPPPPPPPSTSETILEPLIEDAAADVVEEDAKKPTGPGLTGNQLRIKQCCNALNTQAKSMGTAPEAAQIKQAAATCDLLVKSLGPSGASAPELAPLKALLTGQKVPALCQGL